ncbi:sigma-70 family RNA polymerase sigma factor [Candidatus Poribacteria bacterium]
MRTEDGQIIYKCLNGDSAAFGLLVDKYKASIYALAYSKLHNFHDAEDITQEAFVKAYRKLNTLRWWDNFLAWLYAITANLCKDWIRSQSKRPDREFAADQEPGILESSTMDSYREGLVRESLHEALESLPAIYHQVLTLYYLGGMSTREIARFLGTSPSNISHRLRKARGKLKKEMITMMNAGYEKQRLQAAFTFRIVEIVKRISIRPLPRAPLIPWGISFGLGIIFTLIGLTTSIVPAIPGQMDLATVESGDSRPGRSDTNEDAGYMIMPVGLVAIAENPLSLSESIEVSKSQQMNGEGEEPGQPQFPASVSAQKPGEKDKVMVVSGKVLKDNKPVPNAKIAVRQIPSVMKYEAMSQDNGSFQLEMPQPEQWEYVSPDGRIRPKLLLAVARHPQHALGWARLSKDGIADVIINLHKPASISGTTTDKKGDPIAGAQVRIERISLQEGGERYEDILMLGGMPTNLSITDPDGKFVFHNLPEPSHVFLRITARGYAQMAGVGNLVNMRYTVYKLAPEGRIEGTLTFADSGKPFVGAKVTTHGAGAVVQSQTDEHGKYTLTGLSTGFYTITFRDLPEGSDWVVKPRGSATVLEGEVKKLNQKLVPGGFVAGKVTEADTGMPIADHAVMRLSQDGGLMDTDRTAEDGSYRLLGGHGNATIYVRLPKGYKSIEHKADKEVQRSVNIIAKETVTGIDFQFRRVELLTLTGRVLTFDGKPVAWAEIFYMQNRDKYRSHSDKDGVFIIRDVPIWEKLSLEAIHTQKQLRGYADVEVQPDVKIDIYVEKYDTESR